MACPIRERVINYAVGGPMNGAYTLAEKAQRTLDGQGGGHGAVGEALLWLVTAAEMLTGFGADITGGREPITSVRDLASRASPYRLFTHHS